MLGRVVILMDTPFVTGEVSEVDVRSPFFGY